MKAADLLETHERNGSLRKDVYGAASATDSERVTVLPKPPSVLWATGKLRWKEVGGSMVEAGVLTVRDYPALETHCSIYQQMCAWNQALEKLVVANGGSMPLDSDEVDKATDRLQKLNSPYLKTQETLGLGALARASRATTAMRNGGAGAVSAKTGGVPGRKRG